MKWIAVADGLPKKEGKAYLTFMKRVGLYSVSRWIPEIKEFRSSDYTNCQPDCWLEITGPEDVCEWKYDIGTDYYYTSCEADYPINQGTHCPNCGRVIKEVK